MFQFLFCLFNVRDNEIWYIIPPPPGFCYWLQQIPNYMEFSELICQMYPSLILDMIWRCTSLDAAILFLKLFLVIIKVLEEKETSVIVSVFVYGIYRTYDETNHQYT